MLNVGLTGGIASGKSTVAKMFVRHGAVIIDLDKLAHEVEKPQLPAWEEIVDFFGNSILLVDGSINRNKLAKIVFADKEKLLKLNSIVHPHVLMEWQKRLTAIEKKNRKAIVLSDIPLLFEEKLQGKVDLTLLVLVAPEQQTSRLMTRNDMTEAEAQKRLQSQMPIEEKIKLSDIVIENKGTPAETEKVVAKVWQELLIREDNKRKR